MSYHATDADLPAVMWPKGKAPLAVRRASERELKRFVGVHVHYPSMSQSELDKMKYRADRKQEAMNRKDALEANNKHRKIFVKGAKRAQMASWIIALKPHAPSMSYYEQIFFHDQYKKFKRYYPNVKWITLKQFEFLQSLAMKYLELPK